MTNEITLTQSNYQDLYQQSIADPNKFWLKVSESLSWIKQPTQACADDINFENNEWFSDGILNVCYNCVDRHLPEHADRTALIWQGDEDAQTKRFNFQELKDEVCRFANVLKQLGVSKGDRVCLYLPMIPEAVFAMLACARIGAVHSVVFAGFSPEALASRIEDANCSVVITADESIRGGKRTPLKDNVNAALQNVSCVQHAVVISSSSGTPAEGDVGNGHEHNYEELSQNASTDCPIEPMHAEDPLFILYTSGSTGKPKGLLHTQAGYLTYASFTFKTVFDYQLEDIYWCTADVGWITGHSYIVYGPLANAATTLIFAGTPTYPGPDRFWQIIEKYQVSLFYTAPTALRALMACGDEPLQQHSLKSLRILGSVGEPINPEVWQWYFDKVGNKHCPIVDTWWQTETGGFMLTPLPSTQNAKPGSACQPFLGIEPVLLDDNNQELKAEATGKLVIRKPWPGLARTIYGDHERFLTTYLQPCPGYYFSGDGAHRDADGAYWISGRMDDVLNVSGHRLGTAEIESALVAHPAVAEAAVVGYPHEIKGEGIYAFVILTQGFEDNAELQQSLRDMVKNKIGAIAKPEMIRICPDLPKTRSGKIMRRILRLLARGETKDFGDTSTLANPEIVSILNV